MKKIFLVAFLAFLSSQTFSQSNWCGTDQKLKELKENNPGFEDYMHKSMLKATQGSGAQKVLLEIPVVVHILHDNGVGNISDQQVEDALFILNRDYNRENPDTVMTRNTPTAPFKPQAGSMQVEFKLAKIDPNGQCTNGILRVNAPGLTYNANDDCKYTSNGGSDQWPMEQYLNIWVVNSIESDGAGITLGYAYLPYWPNGTNYGILIRNDSFGTIETAGGSDGGTLTHEMGHLLGLLHIFDAGWSGTTGCHATDCGSNGDYCCDTPPQAEADWSCSSTWNSCPDVPLNDIYGFDALDQIENYMSYNDCQNMFSKDQANLMQQNFVDISFMAAVASPANVVATGINLPDVLCKADFDASQLEVCSGDSISFIDRSFHAPTGWIWSVSPGVENTDWAYTGGTNSTSQQPIIRFYTEGLYQITLTATDGVSSDTEVKDQYIRVLPAPVTIPFWEGFESIASLSSTPNWFVSNPGNNNGFEIEPSFGHSGAKCARLLNFGQVISNSDELISSPMDLSVLDPLAGDIVTLSFRYAYRKRAVTDDEWLKVFITKDCNQNWVQRKTLHGNALSSQVATTSWSPAQSDWVTVHVVNITAAYFVENFRFKFEFEGSGGNNFFLDDINLYAGSPSDNIVMGLANEGEIAELSLYPNPAEEEVNVRFSLAGDERTLVQITDLAGKVAGNYVINAKTGANLVSLNTSELAPGSYFVTIQTGDARSTLQFVVK